MNNFARVLREERERAGLTQKEFARVMGVNDTYISRIERESSPPPGREKILAMTEVLGIVDPVDRISFLLAAGCAHTDDFVAVLPTPLSEHDVDPFAAAIYRAQTRTYRRYDPEEERLVVHLRRIFDNADIQRTAIVDLITSYFTWIENSVIGQIPLIRRLRALAADQPLPSQENVSAHIETSKIPPDA